MPAYTATTAVPADEMTARRRRYRWLIFALLALGYLLVYFHRLCPAVLALDLMRDLRATGALTGMLGAAYFYPYAIMQLPAGLLSDSWGPRKTITLFFLVAVAGSVLLGFATTVSMAILGRTLVGIGVAMLFVPTMKILAEWFLISEFAAMTGILMAMGGVGSLVAATPLVWISNLIGWRSSFLVVGGFTLLLAILVWVFVRNRPADFGWPSPHPETGGGNRAKIGLGTAVKMVLTRPAFWPLAVWFFFDCGIFFSFGGLWGGPYLMQVYGLTKAEAGRMLSMVAVGMVIGSPLLSWLSDRVFGGRKPVLLLAVTVLVAATGVLAFATAAIPRPAMYLLIFLLSVFSSAVVVIGFTANKELFPVQIAGTATGLVNLFPFAGGAVFQPLLGWILERHGKVGDAFTLAGYEAAFRILFIAALIAAAAAFLSRETIKSHV